MTNSPSDRLTGRQRRSARSVVSTLAAGAALAGAMGIVGVAGAAAAPTTTGTSHRVLSTDVHISGDHSRRSELQYLTAHNRYELINQYGKQGKLGYRFWQKDALGTKERAVARVEVFPNRKVWSKQTRSIAPLPKASFGILSTGAQIEQAIRDGVAHPEGLGRKDGQRVRLLTLKLKPHERSAQLWVNPSTLQPVAAASSYMNHGGHLRIVSSHWESVSSHALDQIVTQPKVPAGFKVTPQPF